MDRYTLGTEPKPERRGVRLRQAAAGVGAVAGVAAVVSAGVHHHSDVISKTLTVDCARGPHRAVADGLVSDRMQVLLLEVSDSKLAATVTAALGGVALNPGDYEQRPAGDPIIDVGKATLISGELGPAGLYRGATTSVSLVCPTPFQQASSDASVPALKTG